MFSVDNPVPCPAGTYFPDPYKLYKCGDECSFDYVMPPKWYLLDCIPCSPGYYCPDQGAVDPTPCPAGTYCPNFEHTTPGLNCEAGYYCGNKSMAISLSVKPFIMLPKRWAYGRGFVHPFLLMSVHLSVRPHYPVQNITHKLPWIINKKLCR